MNAAQFLFQTLSTNASVTAIVGASPSRIFEGTIPQESAIPAIVYNSAGGSPESLLTDPAIVDHERLQIDCYAATAVAALALREAVRLAFENLAAIPVGFGAKCVSFNAVPAYEPDTKRFRKSFDWSFVTSR